MLLAIDFDGVIHDYKNPVEGRRMGEPINGAKESLQGLKAIGHELVIHTVKASTLGGMKAVIDWMNYYEIPFDFVVYTKPNADVFIDDKAIRFNDWAQTLAEVQKI